MNITTNTFQDLTFLKPDCSNSTAVRHISILLHDSPLNDRCVLVCWANGDEWAYHVPLKAILANIGVESVGQFANAMKRESIHTAKVNAREAVGV